jgi:hypothetical protein
MGLMHRLTLTALVLGLSCARPSVPPVTQAERFIAALNAADTVTMLALTEDPLVFREQKWMSARDGSGYQLGVARDTVVRGNEARRRFLGDLASRVHVQVPTAVDRPPRREVLLENQLAGGDARWASLTLFVFLRGEGDVEHSALTGVDEKSGKVAAFYVN